MELLLTHLTVEMTSVEDDSPLDIYIVQHPIQAFINKENNSEVDSTQLFHHKR